MDRGLLAMALQMTSARIFLTYIKPRSTGKRNRPWTSLKRWRA
jgi:hypothetical protein